MHQQAQLRLKKDAVEKLGAETYVVLALDTYRTRVFKEENWLLGGGNGRQRDQQNAKNGLKNCTIHRISLGGEIFYPRRRRLGPRLPSSDGGRYTRRSAGHSRQHAVVDSRGIAP